MMKFFLSAIIILFLFVIPLVMGFGEYMVEASDQTYEVIYYGSFSGYNVPLKPIEKLSEDEAVSRKTYCMGYYDTHGNLIRFTKYLHGALFFQHEYKYHDNGKIKENRIIDVEGVVRINKYDRNGKSIN